MTARVQKKSYIPRPPAAIMKEVKGRIGKALQEGESSCNRDVLEKSSKVNDRNIWDVFFTKCRNF